MSSRSFVLLKKRARGGSPVGGVVGGVGTLSFSQICHRIAAPALPTLSPRSFYD